MRLMLATALAATLLIGAQTAVLAQDDAEDPGAAAFSSGDYTAAMDAWKPKADSGDPEAMTNIGTLYNLGLGVARSPGKAAEWYEKAAQLGFVIAQFNLANLYYSGQGVERDLTQAGRWYTAAAKGGHAKAQLYLAQMYDSGEGVDKDSETALQWYQKASDQELPEGQYELGRKLIYGDNIAPDPAKGTDLVLKSAEQHYAKAQMLIADCYWRARGVEKNLIEGYVWAAQAMDNPRIGKDASKAEKLFENIKSNMNGGERKAAEIELMAVDPKRRKDKEKDGAQDSGGADAPQ